MHKIPVMIAADVWADGVHRPAGKVAVLTFDSAAALLRVGKARAAYAAEVAAAGIEVQPQPELAPKPETQIEAVAEARPRRFFGRVEPEPENN